MPEESELAEAIQEITRHAQLIVREEIELAKAEMTVKAMKLAKGAGVGVAAAVFVIGGLIYFGHAASWFIWEEIGGSDNFWIGFLIVAVLLFLMAVAAGYIAYRFIQRGAPPTPQMAIEEAQLVRDTISPTTPTPGSRP